MVGKRKEMAAAAMRKALLVAPAVMCMVSLAGPALASDFRKSDVDKEMQRMNSEDAYERKSGAYHLSEMGKLAVPAIPRLIELLKDPVAFGEAAATLGKIKPEGQAAVPALVECLKNREMGRDRAYVATALGDLKSQPKLVIPVLVKTLEEDDETVVREFCADALGDFGADAKDTVPVLIKAVKDGDKDLRKFAAGSIAEIGGRPKDVPALIELLSDEMDTARMDAAIGLGKIGPEAAGAVPQLIKLLKDPSPEVRKGAVEALGDLASEAKSAVPGLKEMQSNNDEDEWVKTRAKEVAEKIEGQSGRNQ